MLPLEALIPGEVFAARMTAAGPWCSRYIRGNLGNLKEGLFNLKEGLVETNMVVK